MQSHEANIELAIAQIDAKIADLQRERARLSERLDYWRSNGKVSSAVFSHSKPRTTCNASTSSSDVAVQEVIQW